MIYTCYEMIRDCRADRAEGWRYFVANYVPVMRRIAAHYAPETSADELIARLVSGLRGAGSSLFESLDPAPERWFVAQLRQQMLAGISAAAPENPLPLEVLAEAWSPLTLTQKLAAWLETMQYDAKAAGTMLRMAPPTVEKIRGQAADLLRGKLDHWSRALVSENGRALGIATAGAAGKECLTPKVFLDVLDGRATWQDREDMERHASGCWHCIDHFGRMAEVIELLRGARPLEDTEISPWLELMGVAEARRSFWRRRT